jgi:hypothetical protein
MSSKVFSGWLLRKHWYWFQFQYKSATLNFGSFSYLRHPATGASHIIGYEIEEETMSESSGRVGVQTV